VGVPVSDDPIERMMEMVRKRVRYTDRGMGATHRVLLSPPVMVGTAIEAPYSVVVEGEVSGWTFEYGVGAFLDIAGYGPVAADLCEIIEEGVGT
jgi:hypothetical protein